MKVSKISEGVSAEVRKRLEQRSGVVIHREAVIEARENDKGERQLVDENRSFVMSFSSDTPIMRFGDIEILEHGPENVRLERFTSGTAALLIGHGNTMSQVGVIEDAWLQEGRGMARARFGKSELANEIMADVNDGIRRLISVGFIVHTWQVTEKSDGPWEFRAIDWEPVEASIVSIPADSSVGIGRQLGDVPITRETENEPQQLSRSQRRAKRLDEENERERCEAIEIFIEERIPKHFSEDERARLKGYAAQALREGWPVSALQAMVKERILAEKAVPVPSVGTYGGYARWPDSRDGIEYQPEAMNRESRDRVMRAFGETRQVAEARAYISGQWFLAEMLGNKNAQRWLEDGGYWSRAMGGGVNAKGGALVPEELSTAVIDLREEFGVFRQFARFEPMGSDTMTIPRRVGRVAGQWLGENEQMSDSDGEWTNVGLVARKLGALTRISSEVFEDAVINLAMFLANEFAESFAESEDDAGFNGDGTSTYGGITSVLTKLSGAAGEVTAGTGNDTFAEITDIDLSTLASKLPVYALPNAAWYCSQVCNQLVFQRLARASGGATMTERGRVQISAYGGFPIRVSTKLPTSTGSLSGLPMLLFGDLRKATILGDRRGFRFQVLEERYADFDQIGVKATERLDITVHDVDDATTAGPMVSLIGA